MSRHRINRERNIVRKYYGLPALTTLAVFEAAARQASFARAAEELNVTPGAISRQVKALEEELGTKLFLREGNGVRLTAAAEDLFSEIAASFSRCSEAIQAIKVGKRIESVTLACTDAFANFWLMPRMRDFWKRHPDIVVNHLISDNVRDFRRAEVDLFIHPGKAAWPNERWELMFGDLIYPVCGSDFADRHRSADADDLATLPLLHMEWTNPEWTHWPDVLQTGSRSFGILPGGRFGKYSVLLKAAEADQGVALGWDALVRPLIDSGVLVKFTDMVVVAPVSYFLGWNEKKNLSDPAATFRTWIMEQAERMPHRS